MGTTIFHLTHHVDDRLRAEYSRTQRSFCRHKSVPIKSMVDNDYVLVTSREEAEMPNEERKRNGKRDRVKYIEGEGGKTGEGRA